MSANSLSEAELSSSAKRFLSVVEHAVPTLLIHGHRKTFIRDAMVSHGWTPEEVHKAIHELILAGILHRSKSRKCVGLQPFPGPKSAACVYCSKIVTGKRLTRDHVTPKSHGGVDQADNIVNCCYDCNQSKRDRTPRQWARDILSHQRPVNPIRFRIDLMVASIAVFVAWIGGAK